MIVRFDPKTKQTSVFTDDSGKSNGLMFDAKGRLLACEGANVGGRCVAPLEREDEAEDRLADKYQGKRFNACNDICLDREGPDLFHRSQVSGRGAPRAGAHGRLSHRYRRAGRAR